MGPSDTVWKYPFEIQDEVRISMPEGALVLHVATQRGAPCLWAVGNSNAPRVWKRFAVRGTGHPLNLDPDRWSYVGSFQMLEETLVFHVFEVRP